MTTTVKSRIKVGDILTKKKLNNVYGKHWTNVLSTHGDDKYLEQLPRFKRKELRKYTVVRELPTEEEMKELLDKRFTMDVADIVNSAFSTFEELKDELQEWYDNLPEAFQYGEKGQALEEAIQYLEGACEVDVPDELCEVTLVIYPALDANSRPRRLDEAIGNLQTVIDYLQGEFKGEIEQKIDELQDEVDDIGYEDENKDTSALESEVEKLQAQLGEIDSFTSELEQAIGEVENVEFPGMFG